MNDTPTPNPTDSEDAALLVGIAQGFSRALVEALKDYPDLIEGFLADRYRFAIRMGAMQVIPVEDPDFHRLFDLPTE